MMDVSRGIFNEMNESNQPEQLRKNDTLPVEEEAIELIDLAEDDAAANEEVIELTDIANTPSDDIRDTEADDIIELTEIVTDTEAEMGNPPEPIEEEIDRLDEMVTDEIEDEKAPSDDLAGSLGVDLPTGTEAPFITPEQLDAAIERVVKKMFSDKIDALLNRVIEKEVSKEIDRMRHLLSQELPEKDDSV
jgi:hypothetical protein